jgi:hypothetical protein
MPQCRVASVGMVGEADEAGGGAGQGGPRVSQKIALFLSY